MLSRRLGKRSLLGTRVSAPDGVLVAPQIHALPADLSRPLAHLAPPEDGSCPQAVEESSRAPRFPSPGHHQLCAGQQVRKEAFGSGQGEKNQLFFFSLKKVPGGAVIGEMLMGVCALSPGGFGPRCLCGLQS